MTVPWSRVANGIIATISFISNGLLCVVILRHRNMLKSSYNVLILTLAITDTITGYIERLRSVFYREVLKELLLFQYKFSILFWPQFLRGIFLIVSPTFALGPENVPVPSGVAGDLFCRIINRGYFVWVFAKFSVSMVTCMAIERWWAIARPTEYKRFFSRRKAVVYSGLLLLWNIAWVAQILFEAPMEVVNGSPKCVFKQLIRNKTANKALVVSYCALTAFVPMLITAATYFHLRFVVRKQIRAAEHQPGQRSQAQLELKLSRMGGFVALAIGFLFMPNQVAYILTKFDVYSYDEPINLQLVVLAMCNSCVNPWIYCLTNRTFRREFARLLCPCRKGNTVDVSSNTVTGTTSS